ncbi:MAG: DUF4384 domain-containing protein [Spirochaetales bacterium]|jgi:hypothetical protein|nr:DUF4384 domain-containing protein [Spirochaetales bacterium]
MKKKLFLLTFLCLFPLCVFAQSIDARISAAVADLGKTLGRQLPIGIGRITIGDTQSVSSLSDFLRRTIADSAAGQRAKFRVVSDDAVDEYATRSIDPRRTSRNPDSQAIQAIVEGSFYQVGENVEVRLRLKSSKGEIWGTSAFVIPAAELKRRGLAFLPPKGDNPASIVSQEEFEQKQAAVKAFSEDNNAFELKAGLYNNAAGILRDGDYMQILVSSNRDCYIKVWSIDLYGNRKLIFPNSMEQNNNMVRAGTASLIPETSGFLMVPPYGEEFIEIAAYDDPFVFNPEEENEMNITGRVSGNGNFDNGTRGIKVVAQKNNSETGPKATTKFSYTILQAR